MTKAFVIKLLSQFKNWSAQKISILRLWLGGTNSLLGHNFDRRLVLNLANQKKIPSREQLKLLGKFLNPKEKRSIAWLGLIFFFASLTLGLEIFLKHIVALPTEGGEYIEGSVGSPNIINPLFSSLNPVDTDLVKLIYAGLFKYDNSLNLVPDLAESYSIDKNGKIFTLKLKPNLKWQDGEPLTAEDALFTFNTIQNPEAQSPLWTGFQGIIINKIDDLTLTLELPRPFAPFLHLLTIGVLPEHLWQEVMPKNIRFSSLNFKPIGAGPFMFSAFTKDSKGNIKTYTLKSNPYYHLPKPYLKNLTFKFFNDQESAFDTLRNHQINGLNSLTREQKDKLNRKSININSLRLPYYTALFFNPRSNLLLKSKNLREALAIATDRQQILTVNLKGEGLIINEPILPGQIGFTQDFKINCDPSLAQKKLDNDNWKKISREEFIEKRKKELYQAWLDERKVKNSQVEKNKVKKLTPEQEEARKKELENQKREAEEFLEKLTIDLEKTDPRQKNYRQKNNYGLSIKITTADQPEFIQNAALIKENWQDLGVQVEIEPLNNEQMKEAIKNRRYEVLLYGVLLGADPDPYPFWHSSQISSPGLNLAGFTNRQADDLLEKARETYDPSARVKLYYEFQKILTSEIPAIFLYTSNYLYPIDNTLKGFNQYRLYTPADRFTGVTDWYLHTKKGWK